MKKSLFTIALTLGCLFNYQNLVSQTQIKPLQTDPFKAHIYFGVSVMETWEKSQITLDPYYKANNHKTRAPKVHLGFQFNKHFAFELGYTSRSLWVSQKVDLGDPFIIHGGSSRSKMTYFSADLIHNLNLTQKLKLRTGIGISIGSTNQEVRVLESDQRVAHDYPLVVVEKRTLSMLSSGTNCFLNASLGLEQDITKDIKLFINALYTRGNKALIQQEIKYNIDGNTGRSINTVFGNFIAVELGARYRF